MNRKEKKFREKYNIKEIFTENMYNILSKELKRGKEINLMNESWFWSIW